MKQQVIDRILANDLSDFEGFSLKGTVPVHEEIINQLITPYLEDFFSDETTAANRGAASDYTRIVKRLRLQFFKVSFEKEKMIVDFEVKR